MALSARITNTVFGMIAEKRASSRRFHRHDPLGSTIGLVNDSATTTDTYTYWPYGTLQASTGSTLQPWKFIGKYGYYTDSATHTYVRARKYRKDLGRWLTVDPLWPGERAYGYARSNPVSQADPSGKQSPLGCLELLRQDNCCQWALAHGYGDVVGHPEKIKYGFTFCCNGVVTTCLVPKNSSKFEAINECTRKHERYHQVRHTCKPHETGPIVVPDIEECYAKALSVVCLSRIDCKGVVPCLEEIKSRICKECIILAGICPSREGWPLGSGSLCTAYGCWSPGS